MLFIIMYQNIKILFMLNFFRMMGHIMRYESNGKIWKIQHDWRGKCLSLSHWLSTISLLLSKMHFTLHNILTRYILDIATYINVTFKVFGYYAWRIIKLIWINEKKIDNICAIIIFLNWNKNIKDSSIINFVV